MKVNIAHADTCLSDYWSGHHLPHVAIMALPSMSFKDVRLLSGDMVKPEDEKRADALTRAAYAAINRDIKPAKKGARRAFPDLEQPGEDCDAQVMAYFVFIIEE